MPVHTAISSLPASPDSVAPVDSAQLLVTPAYSHGFAPLAPIPPVADLSVTKAVMTLPDPAQPAPLPVSALHSTGVMGLMLLTLMAVVVSYRSGYKYMENFVHNMFSTRRRENLFDDHTVNETQILTALIANSCVMQGFLFITGLAHAVPSLAATVNSSIALHVLMGAMVILCYYLFQLSVYHIIGYVFADSVATHLWISGFKATQSLLGLLLTIVVGIMLVAPQHTVFLLSIAAILYFSARIVFICKGFRIFYSNLPSIVFFILYLCSVEIVPIVLLCTGTIYLCQIV